jgi:hypothetical protein
VSTKPAKNVFFAKSPIANVMAIGKTRKEAREKLIKLLWG